MKFIATQKTTRQSPRKVRLVANQVKNLPLTQAIEQLSVIQRRSTVVILKTLKQAIANAINNHGVAFEQLHLDSIIINEGPRYRRFQAVSRGRAHGIIKRTSHIRVELSTSATSVAAPKKAVKASEVKADTSKTETKKTVKTAQTSTNAPMTPRQMQGGKGAQPVKKAVVRNKAGKK